MEQLTQQACTPCLGSDPPVSDKELEEYLPQVPNWHMREDNGIDRLERVFTFKNFVEALAFTNKVGALAESAGHHPAILTEWGRVKVTWWTHAIRGLHRNDFIMAAKTDQLYS